MEPANSTESALSLKTHREEPAGDLQTERLAAIGRSLAGVAHESRNALQRGHSNLEMLSLELHDRPELLELTMRTQRALDDIQHLFGEVRSFATPLQLEMENRDVSLLWSRVWNDLEISHRDKPIDLVASVRCHDTMCDVDDFRLSQVFRNIFENAISACQNPGRIDVECRDAELGSQAALEVCIRDNGTGIQSEPPENIFEPFFTTKSSGTGLGMAIANEVVSAHGGRIVARNSHDSGAEIVLSLPRLCRCRERFGGPNLMRTR